MNENQETSLTTVDLLAQNAKLQAIADRYTELYEFAPVGYLTLLRDGKISQTNRTGALLLNCEPAHLVGEAFSAFVAINFRPLFELFLQRLFSDESQANCEVALHDEGAQARTIHIEASVASDGAECRAVMTDITARKQAELALQTSEKRYKTLVEHTPFCVHEIDLEGRVESINIAGLEMLEVESESQVCGSAYMDNVGEQDYQRIERLLHLAFSGRASDFEFVSSGKLVRYFRSCFIPIKDDEDRTIRILGITEDVTERRQADESLRISTQLLEASQSIGKLGGWELDLATGSLYWTAETYRIHDTSPEKFNPTADPGVSYFLPESRATITAALEAAKERGEGYDLELETLTTTGRRIDVRTTCAVTLRDGKPSKLTGIFQDITERKRGEVALLENQTQLQLALQAANIGPWDWDLITGEVYFSPEWKQQIGYDDDEIANEFSEWTERLHPEDRDSILTAVDEFRADPAKSYSVDFRLRHKTGSYRWIHSNALLLMNSSGQPVRMFGAHLDITERKQAENHLLRSQRMESLGTLASGVAHDLNNALAPILMGTELLRMEYPEATDTVDLLEVSAKRGADMVQQLLTFAKGAEGERAAIHVVELVEELHHLMRGTFPKNIDLEIKFEPDLPLLIGDATQLHRILLNLCVNARDAMPDGGTLSVATRVQDIDEKRAQAIHEAQACRFIEIEIRDTGMGISPEHLERITDPFFTTKGPHKGTGLGLSTVMGILKGHGGFLQVQSQWGGGTTFKIYLPIIDESYKAANTSKPETEFRGHGETILFVDDEVNLRKIAAMALQRLNFKPLTAVDGADGLITALNQQSELSAVIVDLHMPTMNGLELVRKLRQFLPSIPIMVSSGLLDSAVAAEFRALQVFNFLDKPFTERQLAQELQVLLPEHRPNKSQSV
ncbi:MAG: PAS domain S-box-containing protein [Planctomycetota bacterium]|jgi:PAS domain S-box-containing protein